MHVLYEIPRYIVVAFRRAKGLLFHSWCAVEVGPKLAVTQQENAQGEAAQSLAKGCELAVTV